MTQVNNFSDSRQGLVFLVVLSSTLECQVWQTAIKSQQCHVISSSDDLNLESLNSLIQKESDRYSQVVLIADMNKLEGDNPYSFCRSFNKLYPTWTLVLIDSGKTEISRNVRRWAIAQGAAEFLAATTIENGIENTVRQVSQVFEKIDDQSVDLSSLQAALLDLYQIKYPEKTQPAPDSSQPSTIVSGELSQQRNLITYRGKTIYQTSSVVTIAPQDIPDLANKLTYRGKPYTK